MNNKERNGIITLYKIVFVTCIIIMHWSVPFNGYKYFMEGAYIFVDFFFVLQGFYLLPWTEQSEEQSENIAFQYGISRLKRFWSSVAIQSVLLAMVEFVFYCSGVKDYVKTIVGTGVQLSFISTLFPRNLLNNGTMWFLSAYIIVGTAIVYCLAHCGKKYLMVAPLISICIYNYIISSNGSLDCWWQMAFGGIIQMAIPRAVAGVCMGLSCRWLFERIKGMVFPKYIENMLKVLRGGGILILLLCIIYIPHTYFDYFLLFIFAFLIVEGNRIHMQVPDLIKNADKIIFPMYVFQVLAIRIVRIVMRPCLISCICVLVLDFVLALCWTKYSSVKR